MLEIFYILFFALWLVLSALWQFSRIRERAHVFGPAAELRLFPIYTFFAPIPGIADYHMLIRDEHADGSVSGWEEIEIVRPRHALHWVWNPNKRRQKLVADALSAVKQAHQHEVRDDQSPEIASARLRLSPGYITLQNLACSVARRNGAVARQFIIAESVRASGTRELIPILRSPFHLIHAAA